VWLVGSCGMLEGRRGFLTRKGWFRPSNLPQAGPHVITYRASLDVPEETLIRVPSRQTNAQPCRRLFASTSGSSGACWDITSSGRH
jgi:hypothetical protein